jgi:hypothetical protein
MPGGRRRSRTIGELDRSVTCEHRLDILLNSEERGYLNVVGLVVALNDLRVPLHPFKELGFELVALLQGCSPIYTRLQPHCDQQADADGGDVDEEVIPRVGGFVL